MLFWGLNGVPLNEAASRVSEVIVDGLSLSPFTVATDKLPPFTVVHCSKNFGKINVDSVQTRFLILSNSKKLKGKEFGIYKSLFIRLSLWIRYGQTKYGLFRFLLFFFSEMESVILLLFIIFYFVLV